MSHDFDAFISYRRSDGAQTARWLRRALQSYRVPRALRTRHGKRLKVYLDTAYERGTSDFYESTIRPALLGSRWLLVLATPDARLRPEGAEDWIQREVSDFAAGPNGRNVVAVRGAGKFDDPLPADLLARFPRIEIVDLRGASRFSFLNPVRTARLSAEKLKLAASLHDLSPSDMPALRQEEELRQQTRSGGALGATLGVLTAVSALSVYALQSRYYATRSLEESLFATGRMVLSAEDSGQSMIVFQGCDLIDKLSTSSGVQPQIAESVACGIERARTREGLHELNSAQAELENIIATAKARHAETKRVDAADAALKARRAYAEFFVRQDRTTDAFRELQKVSEEIAGFLHNDHPRSPQLMLAEASNAERKGELLSDAKDHAGARDAFETAATAMEHAIARGAGDTATLNVSLTRMYRLAGEQRQAVHDWQGARVALKKAIAAPAGAEGVPPLPEAELERAISLAQLYQVERASGDAQSAKQSLEASQAQLNRLIASEAMPLDLRERVQGLRSWLSAQRID